MIAPEREGQNLEGSGEAEQKRIRLTTSEIEDLVAAIDQALSEFRREIKTIEHFGYGREQDRQDYDNVARYIASLETAKSKLLRPSETE